MDYLDALNGIAGLDLNRDDIFIYSVPPHDPGSMIVYRIEDQRLKVVVCGVEIEDREPEIRKQYEKCLI